MICHTVDQRALEIAARNYDGRRHQLLLDLPPSRMQNWDGEVLLRRQLPP
jgi:hypothetical protein